MRRILILMSAAALALSIPAVITSEDGASIPRREKVLNILNEIRSNHDLKPLRLDPSLSRKARRHSLRMAERGELFHSDLEAVLRGYPWNVAGENVGAGWRLRAVIRAWMRSPEHRRNILDRRFKVTGIGGVKVEGTLWLTVIFYG
jgi:uncharacterized protein YkwD